MDDARTTHGRRAAEAVTRRRVLGRAAAAGAAVSAGAAAACGVSGQQPGAPALQPATIRYLHSDTGQQVWQDNWRQIFGSFEAKYPGVKLQTDMSTFGTPIIEKAIATFAAGDTYDVLYGHASFLSPWLEANLLQPLDGFLSKDREVKAEDFHPAATERKGGKLYGIAWFVVGAEIWYNADLLAEVGVTKTPKQLERDGQWTWDALLDVARKVTRTEGNEVKVYGYQGSFQNTTWVLALLWPHGADWFDKGFTRPTIDAAQFVTATQFGVDMVARHRVAGGGTLAQKTLAMQTTSSHSVRAFEEQIMRQNPFKMEMTLVPKGPAGRGVAWLNNANYIGRTSKAPDAAWAFYKYLIGPEVQPQMAQLGGGRYVASKKVKPRTLVSYEDLAVYEASAAISRPLPLIIKQADLSKDWGDAWKDMIDGNKGVRDALGQLQTRATQLLKEGGCIC